MANKSMDAVKRWLNRGYRIYDSINSLDAAKARAYELATGTTTVLRERVQESHGNGTENRLAEYLKYSNQLERTKAGLFSVLSEIEYAIAQVEDNTLRTLLTYRYLNFMKWEEIALTMHYSYVHVVHNLHPKALRQAGEIIFREPHIK